jgi:hypothetical protein
MSPDGRWWWDGTRWVPITQRQGNSAEVRAQLINVLVIGARLWVAFPVGIGVLMFIVTPTYWRPMLSAPLGFELLAVGLVVIAGGLVLTEVAGRLMRRGGGALAGGILLIICTFFLQFITIWIILLGPALIILSTTKQPSQ